jgi:hypothetical protein
MITYPLPQRKSEYKRPAPPVRIGNANLIDVLLLASGALMLAFDGPVVVDADSPPTTWSFNGITSIQPGSVNFGPCTYIILNGSVGSGDPVVFGANDPGARTSGGGYVNAVTMAVSKM